MSIEDAVHYYNRSKPLPNLCVGGIALQTLWALCYVHSRGIVHCDVKPENLLSGPAEYSQGIPMTKLSDFGHASHLEGAATSKDREIWSTNKGSGTPYYFAPEVLESTRRGAERGVWEFGVSVLALMVGDFLFSPNHAPGKQVSEEPELLAATLPSSARSFTFELLNSAWEKIPTPTQAMTQQWMREAVALDRALSQALPGQWVVYVAVPVSLESHLCKTCSLLSLLALPNLFVPLDFSASFARCSEIALFFSCWMYAIFVCFFLTCMVQHHAGHVNNRHESLRSGPSGFCSLWFVT
jgi:serine/threonine protein kinase